MEGSSEASSSPEEARAKELDDINDELRELEDHLRRPSRDRGQGITRQASQSISDALTQLGERLEALITTHAVSDRLHARVQGMVERVEMASRAVEHKCPLEVIHRNATTPAHPHIDGGGGAGSALVRSGSSMVLTTEEMDERMFSVEDGVALGGVEAHSVASFDRALPRPSVPEPRPECTLPQDQEEDTEEWFDATAATTPRRPVKGEEEEASGEEMEGKEGGPSVTDTTTSTIAGTSTSTVFSWGRSDCGALLHDDDRSHEPGEPVAWLATRRYGVVSFAAGTFHAAYATNTGEVYACGQNEEGQVRPGVAGTALHRQTSSASEAMLLVKPTLVEPLLSLRIVAVACGAYHTACLTSKGQVLTYGGNEAGQLGHGRPEDGIARVPCRAVRGLQNKDVCQVACGDLFTLALTTDGEVYSFGASDATGHGHGHGHGSDASSCMSGEAPGAVRGGHETTAPAASARRVDGLAGVPVVHVSAGGGHSVAVSATGYVYAWGRNNHGQTGTPTAMNDDAVVALPARVRNFLGMNQAVGERVLVTSAACGEAHTVLLDSEGGVWGCGRNTRGQLSSAAPSDVATPRRLHSPTLDETGRRVVEVACGSLHTLMLCGDGSVLSCGAADSGQCNGSATNFEDVKAATPVPAMGEGVTMIAAGGAHSLALRATHEGQLTRQFSQVTVGATPHSRKRALLEQALDDQDFAALGDGGMLRECLGSAGAVSAVAFRAHESRGATLASAEAVGMGGANPHPHETARVSKSWSVDLDVMGLERLYTRILLASSQASAGSSAGGASVTANAAAPPPPIAPPAPSAPSPIVKHLAHAVYAAASGLFGKDGLGGPPVPPHPDTMRCVLALWQCPLLGGAAGIGNLGRSRDALACLVQGVDRAFVNGPAATRKAFLQAIVADAAEFPHMFRTRFVLPVRELASDTVSSSGRQPAVFQAAVRVLSLLVTVNEWYAARLHEPIVPHTEFVSDAVSELPITVAVGPERLEKGALYSDFEAFRSTQTRSQSAVCRFPFLLRPDTKRQLLSVEARIKQAQAHSQAMQQNLMSQLFAQQQRGGGLANPYFVIHVQREHLVQHTLSQLSQVPGRELRKELKVVFEGEEGVDAGGVRKEFFQLLIERLFSEAYGMFIARHNADLWFNQGCTWSDEEYRLVGMLVGLAIYNSVILDVHFPLVVYKKLLPAQAFTLRDVASLDPELAKGLRQLLDFEPADQVEDVFCRTFEVSWTCFGAENVAELKPGGAGVPVTGENRKEYVQLYVEWLLETSVAQQFRAFKEGFDRVMDDATLELLRAEDLEAIVAGTPTLDFSALRRVTQYEGGFADDHPTVQHLWDVVQALDLERQRMFLMFATGSTKAPIGGLGNLPFKVQRMGPDSDNLPTSHTCFNTLLLPEYATREKLERLVGLAITECAGFGLQ